MEKENEAKQNYIISKEIDEYAESTMDDTEEFISKFVFPKTRQGQADEDDFLDEIADMCMEVDEEDKEELINR